MLRALLAYLDPGSSATILQIVLAGSAGIAAATKLRMNKIKRRLGKVAETGEDEQRQKDSTPAE